MRITSHRRAAIGRRSVRTPADPYRLELPAAAALLETIHLWAWGVSGGSARSYTVCGQATAAYRGSRRGIPGPLRGWRAMRTPGEARAAEWPPFESNSRHPAARVKPIGARRVPASAGVAFAPQRCGRISTRWSCEVHLPWAATRDERGHGACAGARRRPAPAQKISKRTARSPTLGRDDLRRTQPVSPQQRR